MSAHRRNFEDVSIGDELPSLVKGPLTTTHIMRWSAAMENWHKIHYDYLFAVEHDKLPGILINGSFKRNFLAQFLKAWAGPTGWAWKTSFQMRKMNVAGETLTVWGTVTGKREADRYGLIDLECGIRNEAGLESTPGTGVVALPYRDGLPVAYPFVPPGQ
jgi:acyl dehydratase